MLMGGDYNGKAFTDIIFVPSDSCITIILQES